MNTKCPFCQADIVYVRLAVGDEEGVLNARPLATVRAAECMVLVGGFAWRPVDIVAAIAIEASVDTDGALTRAVQELDWHLPHECAGDVLVRD
jgi:hypothetical protein